MPSKFTYESFKSLVMPVIKNAFTKKAFSLLAKAFGTTLTGFQGWIARLIVEKAYSYIAVPVTQLIIRKGFLIYDTIDGKFRLKRIKDAQESNDVDAYRDAMSDL